ncbi:MAG TPA: DUF5666 domain-containing protein [Vicinamibacterales bacterium]|nr:DUF5666 domain-containing protein [Vicinamibacterales bacterium]
MTAGPAGLHLNVSVVGTALNTSVDDKNTFVLRSVPGGDVQLRVSGSGVDGRVTLTAVSTQDTIDLVISVNGATVAMQSEHRNGAADPPNARELNGVVAAFTGTPAAFQFMVGSDLVKGDAGTAFQDGAFANLVNGARVEVKGTQQSGFVQATRIEFDDDARPVPPPAATPAPAPVPTPAPVPVPNDEDADGAIASLTGGIPNLTFVAGGVTVHTNAATLVKRQGVTLDLTALHTGLIVEVEGARQSDGSLLARKIQIEDDENENENEAEVEGTIANRAGTCPAIQFSVSGAVVTTSAATEFRTACTALVNGARVEVKGNRLANGVISASRVEIKH